MTFQELLDGFCRQQNLERLSPDAEGILEINRDNMHIVIREFPELDMLLIYGAIGDKPVEGMDEFAILMLKANHLYEGTHGATLSLDDAEGKICLQNYFAMSGLTVESFTTQLENFCDTFEAWHELLADFRPHLRVSRSEELSSPLNGGGFLRV